MITVKTYAPTSFDHSPAAFPALVGKSEWLVAPVGLNRDSDTLSESNWAAQLNRLGGESEDVEVHRFGHWAFGWYEIIVVRPSSNAARELAVIADDLDGHPVLDENDWSEREQRAADESWDRWSVVDMLASNGVNARTESIVRGLSLSQEQAWDVLALLAREGRIETNNDAHHEYGCGRDDIAKVLRLIRKITRGVR